jgi:hypothetical protein
MPLGKARHLVHNGRLAALLAHDLRGPLPFTVPIAALASSDRAVKVKGLQPGCFRLALLTDFNAFCFTFHHDVPWGVNKSRYAHPMVDLLRVHSRPAKDVRRSHHILPPRSGVSDALTWSFGHSTHVGERWRLFPLCGVLRLPCRFCQCRQGEYPCLDLRAGSMSYLSCYYVSPLSSWQGRWQRLAVKRIHDGLGEREGRVWGPMVRMRRRTKTSTNIG